MRTRSRLERTSPHFIQVAIREFPRIEDANDALPGHDRVDRFKRAAPVDNDWKVLLAFSTQSQAVVLLR